MIAGRRQIVRGLSHHRPAGHRDEGFGQRVALIHEALREFLPGRTVLVITHRLQTLEIADRILVLDQGKVVALGSHAELMKTNPFYQRFHQHGGGMRHAA